MNKTVSSLLLTSALLVGTLVPVVANAQDIAPAHTDTSIVFSQPKQTKVPVDPDHPATADGQDNGGADVPSGSLALLYVSRGIAFTSGDGAVTKSSDFVAKSVNNTRTDAQGKDIADTGAIASNKNLLTEVTDTRGTNAGWTISLSADPMRVTTNTAKGDVGASTTKDLNILKGATLKLNGSAAIVNSSMDSQPDSATDNTTANGSSVTPRADTTTDSTNDIVKNNISGLKTDGTSSTPIYGAKPGSGMLTTTFQLDPANVTLNTIPANSKSGTYAGKLNWTLSDTPAG